MKGNKSFFSKFRGYFLTGIVVTAPIGLTVYLAIIFVNFFDNKLRDLIPVQYHYDKILPIQIPGIGLIVVFLLFNFSSNQYQFVQEYHSINNFDFYLGVDGISMYFVLLTTIIMPIAILSN